MDRNSVINLTVSLINSDSVSEEMRISYIEFLNRFLNQPNSIHKDETSLILQEAKRLKIEVSNYSEDQVNKIIENQKINYRKNTFHSEKIRQNKSSIKNTTDKGKSEFERLNNIIQDLTQKEKQAIASRDEWRKRAELAEIQLQNKTYNSEKKFKKVKNSFSKMYHPDSLTGDRFEKLIKQEIFKEFWQVIEDIKIKGP